MELDLTGKHVGWWPLQESAADLAHVFTQTTEQEVEEAVVDLVQECRVAEGEGSAEVIDVDAILSEEALVTAEQSTGSGKAKHGAYTSGSIEQLLQPECSIIKHQLPHVWDQILTYGILRISVAIDNTSLQLFDGSTLKIEQGVCKILIPLVDSSQQSPYMAIPLFITEGALCRSASAFGSDSQ